MQKEGKFEIQGVNFKIIDILNRAGTISCHKSPLEILL